MSGSLKVRTYRAVSQKPAQWSQHGGQKQYRTKYWTVSTSRRRYTHPRCRINPTTRNEKTSNKNNEIRVSLSDNLINRITNLKNKTKTKFNYVRRCQETIQLLKTYPFCCSTTTNTAGKLHPTIPCNNPESDTGWKAQLHLSNRKNRSTPTSAIIRQRNSQLNIRWSSTHR